ncbi:hypothetical protein LINPERHAP1_LOCUS6761, partial [Linum perenne]
STHYARYYPSGSSECLECCVCHFWYDRIRGQGCRSGWALKLVETSICNHFLLELKMMQ